MWFVCVVCCVMWRVYCTGLQDALESFRTQISAGPVQQEPRPLPYLEDADYARSSYNIALQVDIQPRGEPVPNTVTRSNLRHMYWNMKQHL